MTLGHDERGNLVQSGSSTYGYSRLNELTSAPNPLGGTIQLTYDPKGRLTQVNPGTPVRMVYAGPNLVTEVSAAGTILRRYVHGPGSDEPIVWYEGPGTASRRWMQAVQLGSVVAISDASGASLGINRYDVYGIPQSGNLGRFQYTGQTWWGELGLYNYKARWYSASLGRFMQTDPIGYEDQLNLYAYVGNDPVNGTDPTGERGVWEGCGIANASLACAGITPKEPVTEPASDIEPSYQSRPSSTRPSSNRGIRGGQRGLRSSEGQEHGGHTLTRHVGRTPEQLRARLRREPGIDRASTFASQALANAAYREALRQNRVSINAWLNDGGRTRHFISYTAPIPIGSVLERGASQPRDAYTATFVIQANHNPFIKNTDVIVITGWVE